MAYAESERVGNERENGGQRRREINALDNSGCACGGNDRPGNGAVVAYANGSRSQIWQGKGSQRIQRTYTIDRTTGTTWAAESRLGGVVDGISAGLDGRWLDEPDIPRVATGIKNRVDRLKGLGNAVVPQVAEFIGRLMVDAHIASLQHIEIA